MTLTWRKKILSQLQLPLSRLVVATDPDNLLLEETIQQAVAQLGYSLFTYESNPAIRYIFETKYRPFWERGENLDQAILLRVASPNLQAIPYEFSALAERQLSFSLGDIFT